MAVIPSAHQRFLERALPVLQGDLRICGVAVGGSLITGQMDPFSDLDLIIVTTEGVTAERMAIAERLGELLAAFTGEHVGEPRLLICLYADPLLHVDLKLVDLEGFARRIEDPVVLWERSGELSAAIARLGPSHPMPDLQWIEDRFWVWIHYGALKLGRGELFEVIDFLAFLRGQVLGPLALVGNGHLPRGVRRLEWLAPAELDGFKQTLAGHDRGACGAALQAAAGLYRRLREAQAGPGLIRRTRAEEAALAYLEAVIATP
ncbi:MAG: oxalate:formate antiporter [Bacillota bacterium]